MPYIDLNQFIDEGYLQEVNRQFFHPLGLALCVVVEADGSSKIDGILDYRSDPEGIAFAPDVLSIEKATNVALVQQYRKPHRATALGFWVQPVPLGD